MQLILTNLLNLMRDLKPHLQEALQTRLGNELCWFASQRGVMKFSSGCCVLIWHVRCYTKNWSQLAKCDVERKHGEAAAFEISQLPLVQSFCFGVTGACLYGTAASSDQLHARATCHLPETAHNCFLCQMCLRVPRHTACHENNQHSLLCFLSIDFVLTMFPVLVYHFYSWIMHLFKQDELDRMESWITILLAAACRMPCRKGIGVWDRGRSHRSWKTTDAAPWAILMQRQIGMSLDGSPGHFTWT